MINLTVNSYQKSIMVAVRGLWLGVFNEGQFFTEMVLAVERNIFQAFRDGFAEFGISMDDMSTSEKGAMFRYMSEQVKHIDGLADFVEANSKANDGLLRTSLNRTKIWSNRYLEAKNLARTFASRDANLMWQLGKAEHCGSCLKMEGKVKRGSVWLASGVRPQHEALECGGWRCQCEFIPTSEQATRGPIPSLP